MTKKKRTRIRQTPTAFQKVFAQHPEMVQTFSFCSLSVLSPTDLHNKTFFSRASIALNALLLPV